MLSFKLCKKILKTNTFSNQQIKEMIDSLYQLAEILIENYISNKKIHYYLRGRRKNERQ